MWPERIVMVSPFFDQDFGFAQIIEDFTSQGNHPIFKRLGSWTSRGEFQFHGGGYSADAHVRALIVVSP